MISLFQWGPLEVRSLDPFSGGDQSTQRRKNFLISSKWVQKWMTTCRKTAMVSIQHINLLFIPPFQGPQFHSIQKANPHFLPQLGWWRVIWLYSPESRKGRAPKCFLDPPPSPLFPVPLFPHLDDLIAAHTSASQLSKFLIFSLSGF